jgi:hypothetical protein
MNPSSEFRELTLRSRRLLDAALLMAITFALLLVAIAATFCAVFICAFVKLREAVDQMAEKYRISEVRHVA